MKVARLLVLFASLLRPVAAESQHSVAWRDETLQQAQRILATWQHESRGVSHEFKAQGADVSSPREPAEPVEEGEDTVVTCDGAMLFDTESHNIVYVGNVRLADPCLKLHAPGRLFVRLPEKELATKQDEARQSLEEALPENDSKPHAAPAEKPAETKPTDDKKSAFALPEGMEPVYLAAADAVADAENNHIILFSPAGSMPVTAESGPNKLTVTPAAEQPAYVLADADGNITVVGQEIAVVWVDEKHQRTELQVEGGSMCYNAAAHAVALTGRCFLRRPEGDIRCDRLLVVSLQGKHEVSEDVGFMQQFASVNAEGIAAVYAEGGVAMTTAGSGEQPASSLRAEVLHYDAETGLCSLTGDACELAYAEQYALQGARRIVLSPDGALAAEGETLSGAYQRPSEDGKSLLKGQFRTRGLMTFTPKGDYAEIRLPQGVSASDAEGDFSCTGELTALLLPVEEVKVPQVPASKLNLALARFRTLDRAAACGDVTAHRYAPLTHQETAHLQAERAEFDLQHHAAELFGTSSSSIRAAYNGNTLEATPDGDNAPHLSLSESGDTELRGGMIHASFTDEKKGSVTARCAHALRLLRAENKLETDGATEFRTEQGILVTKGPLYASLIVEEPSESALSRKKGFHLPYTGIREAATDHGGSVQTAQGSMQCTGHIRVTMDGAANGKDAKMAGLKTATAEGNVAIAGKDSTGRIIRATGDRLTLDAATGEKVLTGSRVTLSDGRNTHTVSGGKASVRIDARNNAVIRGTTHSTTVNSIHEQIEQQTKKDKQ